MLLQKIWIGFPAFKQQLTNLLNPVPGDLLSFHCLFGYCIHMLQTKPASKHSYTCDNINKSLKKYFFPQKGFGQFSKLLRYYSSVMLPWYLGLLSSDQSFENFWLKVCVVLWTLGSLRQCVQLLLVSFRPEITYIVLFWMTELRNKINYLVQCMNRFSLLPISLQISSIIFNCWHVHSSLSLNADY